MNRFLRRLLSSSSSSVKKCCQCVQCKGALGSGSQLIKCPTCASIQPPPLHLADSCCPDYYRLLDLPSRFSVDPSQLKGSFLRLQSLVHPDRMLAAGGWSAWINRAHETLKNPLSRAIYLLQRRCPSEEPELEETETEVETEESVTHERTSIAQVLEVRELLDSLDPIKDAKEIDRLRSANDERIKRVTAALQVAIDEKNDLKEARLLINELRYLISIDTAIREVTV